MRAISQVATVWKVTNMFGRRGKLHPHHEEEIEVDVDLEQDISLVEQAVESYLQNPNESLRKDLLAALEELDAQIAQGDDYHGRLEYPFAAPVSAVVGATSPGSVGEELPATEFQAQVALVKAAKNAVTRLTPDTLADLRAANDALEAWRTRSLRAPRPTPARFDEPRDRT